MIFGSGSGSREEGWMTAPEVVEIGVCNAEEWLGRHTNKGMIENQKRRRILSSDLIYNHFHFPSAVPQILEAVKPIMTDDEVDNGSGKTEDKSLERNLIFCRGAPTGRLDCIWEEGRHQSSWVCLNECYCPSSGWRRYSQSLDFVEADVGKCAEAGSNPPDSFLPTSNLKLYCHSPARQKGGAFH
ncbi:unnamed protein product [Allacma fusca]|uniref:Uncharacterized protein n=1 Tax=Allacma fusca TaxID=39272 RepID=A0A8J2NX20_9HEXA|nr:unnamed protein product [Allacma fusca]